MLSPRLQVILVCRQIIGVVRPALSGSGHIYDIYIKRRKMQDSPFKVIKGGLDGEPVSPEGEQKPYTFISAWATDTRLMGVVAMSIYWKDRLDNDVHQYYYFDAVDTGFERFDEVVGDDENAMRENEVSYAGGLGGRKVGLSLDEALYMILEFKEVNKKTGEPAPRLGIRMKKMLSKARELEEQEKQTLFQKICKSPLSVNETINYFMMRICDSDDPGIRFLSAGKLTAKDSPAKGSLYTLYRNKIKYSDKNSATLESLVESDQGYEMWISDVRISQGSVSSYKRKSRMRISDTEAFMTLSHSEFVMAYQLDPEGETLTQDSTPFTRRSQVVEEDDGESFMLFRPNNNHVDVKDYRLYDDIFGVYHLTSTGQLICSSNTQHDMALLELDLVFSPVYKSMSLIGNYEFNEPVMAQFLASGYDDFNRFIAEITMGTDE